MRIEDLIEKESDNDMDISININTVDNEIQNEVNNVFDLKERTRIGSARVTEFFSRILSFALNHWFVSVIVIALILYNVVSPIVDRTINKLDYNASDAAQSLASDGIYLGNVNDLFEEGEVYTAEEIAKMKNTPSAISGYTMYDKYMNGLVPMDGVDSDGDGLIDEDEVNIYHTNPAMTSTAGDAYPDGVKVSYKMDTDAFYVDLSNFKLCTLPSDITADTIGSGNADLEITNITSDFVENTDNYKGFANYNIYEMFLIKNYNGKVAIDLNSVFITNPNLKEKDLKILVGYGSAINPASEAEYDLAKDNTCTPVLFCNNYSTYHVAVASNKNSSIKHPVAITQNGAIEYTSYTQDCYFSSWWYGAVKRIYYVSSGDEETDNAMISAFEESLRAGHKYGCNWKVVKLPNWYYNFKKNCISNFVEKHSIYHVDLSSNTQYSDDDLTRDTFERDYPVYESWWFDSWFVLKTLPRRIACFYFYTDMSDASEYASVKKTLNIDELKEMLGNLSDDKMDVIKRLYENNISEVEDTVTDTNTDELTDLEKYLQSVAIDTENEEHGLSYDEELTTYVDNMTTEEFLEVADLGVEGANGLSEGLMNYVLEAYVDTEYTNPQLEDIKMGGLVDKDQWGSPYIYIAWKKYKDINVAKSIFPEINNLNPVPTSQEYIDPMLSIFRYYEYPVYDDIEMFERWVLNPTETLKKYEPPRYVYDFFQLPLEQRLIIYKVSLVSNINYAREAYGFELYPTYTDYYNDMKAQFYEQFKKEMEMGIDSSKEQTDASAESTSVAEKTYRILESASTSSSRNKIYFTGTSGQNYHYEVLNYTYKLMSNTGEVTYVTLDGGKLPTLSDIKVDGEVIKLNIDETHDAIGDKLSIPYGYNYGKRVFGINDVFKFKNYATETSPGGNCAGITQMVIEHYNTGKIKGTNYYEDSDYWTYDLTQDTYGGTKTYYGPLFDSEWLCDYRAGRTVFEKKWSKMKAYDIDFCKAIDYYQTFRQPSRAIRESGCTDNYCFAMSYGKTISYDLIEIAETYIDRGNVLLAGVEVLGSGHAVALVSYEQISDDTIRFHVYDCNYGTKNTIYDNYASSACYLDVTKVANTTSSKNKVPYTFTYLYHTPSYEGTNTSGGAIEKGVTVFVIMDDQGNLLNAMKL